MYRLVTRVAFGTSVWHLAVASLEDTEWGIPLFDWDDQPESLPDASTRSHPLGPTMQPLIPSYNKLLVLKQWTINSKKKLGNLLRIVSDWDLVSKEEIIVDLQKITFKDTRSLLVKQHINSVFSSKLNNSTNSESVLFARGGETCTVCREG